MQILSWHWFSGKIPHWFSQEVLLKFDSVLRLQVRKVQLGKRPLRITVWTQWETACFLHRYAVWFKAHIQKHNLKAYLQGVHQIINKHITSDYGWHIKIPMYPRGILAPRRAAALPTMPQNRRTALALSHLSPAVTTRTTKGSHAWSTW